MRVIDGAKGEGGGQVLRTSLALSLILGEPIKVINIRAGRERPGLLRQHLCAVNLATEIGKAEVTGAEPGSRELIFRPRTIAPGDYKCAVGTAGSTTLVFQTVLPALLCAKGKSTLVLEGGTHNPLAPPFDFLATTFLPLVNRMGPRIEATLERPGFYPAGGGRMRVTIDPVEKLSPLSLIARGAIRQMSGIATFAALNPQIARRELAVLGRRLEWTKEQLRMVELPAEYGPGNTLSAIIESEHVTEVLTEFGEKRVSAERVAENLANAVREYLSTDVPAGEHLADQLLLPMALAKGGAIRTLPLSGHAKTQLELVREFLGTNFQVEEEDKTVRISIG